MEEEDFLVPWAPLRLAAVVVGLVGNPRFPLDHLSLEPHRTAFLRARVMLGAQCITFLLRSTPVEVAVEPEVTQPRELVVEPALRAVTLPRPELRAAMEAMECSAP